MQHNSARLPVLVPSIVSEEGKRFLRDRGYTVRESVAITSDELEAELAGCGGWLASTIPMPASLLERCAQLRIIARHGVGFDNVDLEAAERLGIWVANTPQGNFNTVAEHTIMMVLVLARRLFEVVYAFRAGDFAARTRIGTTDVEGKTIGILGFGRIGRSVAAKATAGLGMKVIAYDPLVPAHEFPAPVTRSEDLETVLRSSDFLAIHTPATAQTRGLIGAPQFAVMKPGACLINPSRGGIVDEGALADALESGRLAGAAVDVFAEEPPPVGSPLLSLDNVIPTPHNAGGTVEANNRIATHAAMEIDAVLSGGTPRWPVNHPPKPKGPSTDGLQ